MTNVTLYDKGDDIRLSENLHLSELDCNCSKCQITLVHPNLAYSFNMLRKEWSSAIRINSAYRCQHHNMNVGGVSNSRHTMGMAIDVTPYYGNINEFYEIAKKHFSFAKLYINENFVHLDVR
jgi:uncharacterized protein YcbK (DUF882 family)